MTSAAVLLLSLLVVARTASAAVTDSYAPFCGSIPASPSLGWFYWSNSAIWPNGTVPGTGNGAGLDATIPCNTGILLDVPVLNLGTLTINGLMKVSALGPFQVFANFVIVQGRLQIGTAARPYKGSITFTLTSGSMAPYVITRPPGNGAGTARVGVKAFAVIGGQVQLNGMYGNQASWSQLAAKAVVGASSLVLRDNVSRWPVGGTIAIASTDFDMNQAETSVITRVNRRTIHFSPPLSYMHWGGSDSSGGVAGVAMDEAAEVALLTRTIVIQGDVYTPNPLIGGHFIVFQTNLPQFIQGVELVNMGQQGALGRYPMHLHLCQDVTGSSITKCSVHHSNQRCYVVHGSWNAVVEDNVGYNTAGHCFMVEDGIEYGNMFKHNLAFVQTPATVLITGTSAVESDNSPSSFWIANPNNSFVGNHAGGAQDSGYWFQLEGQVEGPSAAFPNAAGVAPKFLPTLRFDGNVAHSNGRAGLRTYPSGYRPRVNGGVSAVQSAQGINAPAAPVVFSNFVGFKNDFNGMFIHETDSVTISSAKMGDNAVVSVEFDRCEACTVSDSYFFGETSNIGNPSGCTTSGNNYVNCRPISGCAPNPQPGNQRSNGITQFSTPQFGILIDQSEYPSHGLTSLGHSYSPPLPHHITNTTFALFNNQCRVSAGITANGKNQDLWSAGHSSSALRYVDASSKFYFAPQFNGMLGFESQTDAGSQALTYVWRDLDGSLVGGGGGFGVTNTPAILPPVAAGCTAMPSWNGYACQNVCYRTVGILPQGGTGNPSFTISRLQDGSTFVINGKGFGSTTFVNLMAGGLYEVAISGTPSSLTVAYGDASACLGGMTLQFAQPSATTQWQLTPGAATFYQECSGSDLSISNLTQVSTVCNGGLAYTSITLGSTSPSGLTLEAQPGVASCTTLTCGLLAAGSSWAYSDGGLNLNSSFAWSNFWTPTWKWAPAAFGYGPIQGGVATTIQTAQQMNGLTWYFRTSFNLTSPHCIDTLTIGTIINDAVVVYINGQEIMRNNLPAGPIVGTTPANGAQGFTSGFTLKTIDASGISLATDNIIAVEVHTYVFWAWEIQFDLYIAATGSSCGAQEFFGAAK